MSDSPRPVTAREEKREPAKTPSTSSSATPSASTPAAGAISIESVKGAWKQVIRDVKTSSPTLASLLSYCQPVDVEGNVIVLRSEHSWVHEKLDDKKKLDGLLAVLNRTFNGKYDVRLFVNASAQSTDPDEDPVVKAAKKQGGVIRQRVDSSQ